jgi:hypothetical protein
MSSGYSGGAPDFFNSGRRSVMNNNNNPQGLYRPPLSGILPDSSSQIVNGRPDLMGKRSLAEFQLQQQQQQQGLGLYLRHVKQRTLQHASPISPLSPVDFSSSISPEISSVSRYGVPILQNLRPQNNNSNSKIPGVLFPSLIQTRQAGQESEKKMMNRLQELEKALLDDDGNEDGDAISVVTNSEWSETIQNLITQNQKPIVISPTSPSSSCSSSSTSSPITCPKQSLVEVATAFSDGDIKIGVEILARLNQVSNSRGTSEQRLTSYMSSALRARVNPTEFPPPVAELYSKDHLVSTQTLYEISPCFKLGFMAANLAILEAVSDQNQTKLHVVDFDIGQEGQYEHLLYALSSRKTEKPAVMKVTAFADIGGEDNLKAIGDGLIALANKVGVCFKFNVMRSKASDLSVELLGVEPDEALAVNLAFRLYKLPDESVTTDNLRDELLRRVKGLSPRVVTVVEQQMNCNTAPLATRVAEACGYYGALFDSLDVTVRKDDLDRVRIEEGLGRRMCNSVACEGRDRVERCEVFGKWRARMSMAGFNPIPLSQNIADSLRAKLNSSTRGNPGFTVERDSGGICFGWKGRTLTVASAWH